MPPSEKHAFVSLVVSGYPGNDRPCGMIDIPQYFLRLLAVSLAHLKSGQGTF